MISMKKMSKISLCKNVSVISEKEMKIIMGGYNSFLFDCYCVDGKHWADWMTVTEAYDSIIVNCGNDQRGWCTNS